LPTVIVYSTLFMANAILVVAPHIVTVLGLAIMLAVLGFDLPGDGLRGALDPRPRGRL
jgi:ABC-type dipeptide/oligopeptide/nickel transport system permease subunit